MIGEEEAELRVDVNRVKALFDVLARLKNLTAFVYPRPISSLLSRSIVVVGNFGIASFKCSLDRIYWTGSKVHTVYLRNCTPALTFSPSRV